MKYNQIRLLKIVISVLMITIQEFLFVKSFCDSDAVRLLLWVVLSVQRKLILCSWDYLLCGWTLCLSNLQYFWQCHVICTCIVVLCTKPWSCLVVQHSNCISNSGQTCYKQYLVNPWKLLSIWNAFWLHNMPKGLLFSQQQFLRSLLPKEIWSQGNSSLAITALVPEGG